MQLQDLAVLCGAAPCTCPMMHVCVVVIDPSTPLAPARPAPRSPMVLQAFVYGDSLRSQLVAVVVPDPEVLVPWAKERGIHGEASGRSEATQGGAQCGVRRTHCGCP